MEIMRISIAERDPPRVAKYADSVQGLVFALASDGRAYVEAEGSVSRNL